MQEQKEVFFYRASDLNKESESIQHVSEIIQKVEAEYVAERDGSRELVFNNYLSTMQTALRFKIPSFPLCHLLVIQPQTSPVLLLAQ